MKKIFVAPDGRVRSGWVLMVFIVVAGLTGVLASEVMKAMMTPSLVHDANWGSIRFSLPSLTAGLVATWFCVKVFREETGLVKPPTIWLGLAAGAAALVLAVVVPAVLGYGSLGFPIWPAGEIALSGLAQVLTVGPSSIGEELLFRGVPFKALSRGTHPLFAIGLTGVIFGAVHLSNPNATLVAAANIALVGVWFGLIAWRISLFASIGLHLAWNWFEGFVFGQPVSGLPSQAALFHATWPAEGSFWSGGDFGPEASGWTAVVLVAAIICTLFFAASKPTKPELSQGITA